VGWEGGGGSVCCGEHSGFVVVLGWEMLGK